MPTVEDLKQELVDVHERFFACFTGFDDTVLETQPVCGVWSARDLAGHLADWNYLFMDTVEHNLNGTQSKIQRVTDFDAFNADNVALRGIDSWEKSAEDLAVSREHVTNVLGRLSEEDLQKIGTLPWGQVERIEVFFKMVGSHVRGHTEEAESWRMRMLGVPERADER